MAAPRKFERDQILDAAADQVLAHGPGVTIHQIAQALEAPVGSLYHRFASREQLLAELWVRSVRRFHEQYLAEVESADVRSPDQAGELISHMAVSVVQHVRTSPANAAAMSLFRQGRLVETTQGELREAVRTVNDLVYEHHARLARVRYGAGRPRPDLVRIAAIELPYGLVRPYVRALPPPPELDDVARVAAAATLALGD